MYMRSQVENHGEDGICPVGTDLSYVSSRHKTVDTLITQIFGEKDYYTHTLKADYPIEVSFIQGPATPVFVIPICGIRTRSTERTSAVYRSRTSGSATTTPVTVVLTSRSL